jgi:hypothetical protein
MIARVRAFGRFWYDFVVGDDWRIALGVATTLALTWLVTAHTSVSGWWIVVAAVLVLLPASLLRAVRKAR